MVEQPPVSRTSGINSSLTATLRLLLFTFKIKIPIVLILRQKAYYIRRRNGCVTFSVTIITITSPQSYGDSNPDHSIWNLPRETPGHSLSLIKQKKSLLIRFIELKTSGRKLSLSLPAQKSPHWQWTTNPELHWYHSPSPMSCSDGRASPSLRRHWDHTGYKNTIKYNGNTSQKWRAW